MEKTNNFQTLIEYLNNFEKTVKGNFFVDGPELQKFQVYLENFENEILINSNSENDNLRIEKILLKLKDMFSYYFTKYNIEFDFIKNDELKNFLIYEPYFIAIKSYLNSGFFKPKYLLNLSSKITKQKQNSKLEAIYEPIVSLHKSPLTRNSLKLCYAINFLNIYICSQTYKSYDLKKNPDNLQNLLSEFKSVYNSSFFSHVKNKKLVNGELNDFYYLHYLSEFDKVEPKDEKFTGEGLFLWSIKLIIQDICKLYIYLEKFEPETNETNLRFNKGVSNDFRSTKADIGIKLDDVHFTIVRAANANIK
jgi:hypothetical protein